MAVCTGGRIQQALQVPDKFFIQGLLCGAMPEIEGEYKRSTRRVLWICVHIYMNILYLMIRFPSYGN